MFTCGNLGNLWFLRGHQSIMQNKPNFLNGKTNATSYATQIYSNIPLRPSPKKQTQTKPILQRNTQHAIRDTQHAIRKPNPNKPNSSNRKNDPKPLPQKALWKSLPPPPLPKTNPIKPNSPTFFRVPASAQKNSSKSPPNAHVSFKSYFSTGESPRHLPSPNRPRLNLPNDLH